MSCEALQRAWQWIAAGDRLVLIGAVAREALSRLPVNLEVMGGEVATLRALLCHEVAQRV